MFSMQDVRFWSPAKDGIYSVKSGYWLGLLGHTVEDNNSQDIWRIVWKIGGPPKLSHFLWQACKENMAVKEVLYKRHIATDEMCVLWSRGGVNITCAF